jgi:hypothetical protein
LIFSQKKALLLARAIFALLWCIEDEIELKNGANPQPVRALAGKRLQLKLRSFAKICGLLPILEEYQLRQIRPSA